MSYPHNPAAAPRPAVLDPDRIRNVALVGHPASGKTTLAHAFARISTFGHPNNSVPARHALDAEPEAARGTRLHATVLHGNDITINVIDTPGHPDFAGQVHAGLRAADAAIFVISASGGMDAATQQWWRECDALGLPRAIAVTKLDGPFADIDETVALCQRMFDPAVVSTALPMLSDDGSAVAGLIELLSTSVFDYSNGHPPHISSPEAVHLDGIADARAQLIETVLAQSDDEKLVDAYVAGDSIDTHALVGDLESGVAHGTLFPAIPVDATAHVGVDVLWRLIHDAFQPPSRRHAPPISMLDESPAAPLAVDPTDRLAAQVIHTYVRADGHRVCLLRVFAGTLHSEATIRINPSGSQTAASSPAMEQVRDMRTLSGANLTQCGAGDMCTIVSATAQNMDTISGPDTALRLDPWHPPEPQFPVAIATENVIDPALQDWLAGIVDADPCARLQLNPQTQQQLLWCLGDVHAAAILERVRIRGFRVDTDAVRTADRATFTTSTRGKGAHGDETGSVECEIEIAPLTTHEGVEFVDATASQLSAAQARRVEDAIRTELARGFANAAVTDVRVKLLAVALTGEADSEVFETAATRALHAAANANTITLAPAVDTAVVTVPHAYVRPVLGDLKARHGTIHESLDNGDDHTIITAEVPATQLLSYALELRTLTSGSGRFTREFSHYESPKASTPHQSERV